MKYGTAKYGTFKYAGNVVRDNSLMLEYNGACGKNVPATTVLKDLSGKGNDATLTGFDYLNNPYNFDGFDDNVLHGLKFNGGQQVAIPTIQGFSLGAITMETYFYLPNLPSASQLYMPISLSAPHYISVYNVDRCLVSLQIGGVQKSINVSAFSAQNYYHIVLTYDGANMALYINGSYVTSISATGNLSGQVTTHSFVGGYSTNKFVGNIYTTKIYNRALSATEVTQNYNARGMTYGYVQDNSLILDYNFNLATFANNVAKNSGAFSVSNLCTNGDFENGLNNFNQVVNYGGTSWVLDSADKYNGTNSIKCTSNGYGKTLISLNSPITANKKYYIKTIVKSDIGLIVGVAANTNSGALTSQINIVFSTGGLWQVASELYTPTTSGYLGIIKREFGTFCNLDDLICINLTATYGAGNEPTKAQCDALFQNYFTTTNTGNLTLRDINTSNAIAFDGSDDYINCGNSSVLDFSGAGKPFTLECLFRKDITTATGYLIAKNTSSTTDVQYGLLINGTTGLVTININGTAIYLNTSYNIPTNTFCHLVVTYDLTNFRLYANGSLVYTSGNYSSLNILYPTSTVYVGRHAGGGYFVGQISTARIYNRALPLSDVQTNYNNRNNAYGYVIDNSLVLDVNAYRQQGINSNTSITSIYNQTTNPSGIRDFTGLNTIQGVGFGNATTTGWTNTKNNGELVAFDYNPTTSGWIDTAQSPIQRFFKRKGGTGRITSPINILPINFTVECWVRVNNIPLPNTRCVLASTRSNADFALVTDIGFDIVVESNGYLSVFFADGANLRNYTFPQTINVGSVYHIVMTKTDARTDIYVDSVFKLGSSFASTVDQLTASNNITFASRADGSYSYKGGFMVGRFYNVALTQDQITQNYNAGFSYDANVSNRDSLIYSSADYVTETRIGNGSRTETVYSGKDYITENRIGNGNRTADIYTDNCMINESRIGSGNRSEIIYSNDFTVVENRVGTGNRNATLFANKSFVSENRIGSGVRNGTAYTNISAVSSYRVGSGSRLADIYANKFMTNVKRKIPPIKCEIDMVERISEIEVKNND